MISASGLSMGLARRLPRLKLQMRVEAFANAVSEGKTIHLTMVTSRGLVPNAYSRNVQSEVVLGDLFDS